MTTASLPFIARRLAVWLLAGAIVTAALAFAAPLIVRLASSPNATVRLHVPSTIDAFTERDGFAYPLHAALGSGFNLTPGTAEAAAIQWVKAADHARSPEELANAAHGIAIARGRTADLATFTARVCWVADRGNPQILQALSDAAIPCTA